MAASLVAQLVKNLPTMWETWVRSLGWEHPLEKERLPTPVFWPGEFHGLWLIFEELPDSFPKQLQQLKFPPAVYKGSNFSMSVGHFNQGTAELQKNGIFSIPNSFLESITS